MKKLLMVLPLLFMVGCAEYASTKSGIADHGAKAADDALDTAVFVMCNAGTVGSIERRFKTAEEQAARKLVCGS